MLSSESRPPQRCAKVRSDFVPMSKVPRVSRGDRDYVAPQTRPSKLSQARLPGCLLTPAL